MSQHRHPTVARRGGLAQLITAGCAGVLLLVAPVRCLAQAKGCQAKVVDLPGLSATAQLYTANRPPLTPSRLMKLPLGSITPKGWVRHQLELEAQGMTGRLPEVSKWCQFEGNAWADPNGQGHSAWEELPYWLKGYGDLGYVLRDETISKHARQWIDAVLASQDADGYFGPRANQTGLKGQPDLWPHMVMLNVLQSYYEFSGDERVLPFMLQPSPVKSKEAVETVTLIPMGAARLRITAFPVLGKGPDAHEWTAD